MSDDDNDDILLLAGVRVVVVAVAVVFVDVVLVVDGKARIVSPRINPTPTPIPKMVMAAFRTAVAKLVAIKRE